MLRNATTLQDRCRWPATASRLWRQRWKSKANRNRTSAALRPNVLGSSNWSRWIVAFEVEENVLLCWWVFQVGSRGVRGSDIVTVGSWKWPPSMIGKSFFCLQGILKCRISNFVLLMFGACHTYIVLPLRTWRSRPFSNTFRDSEAWTYMNTPRSNWGDMPICRTNELPSQTQRNIITTFTISGRYKHPKLKV